jgi:hypothetical protein
VSPVTVVMAADFVGRGRYRSLAVRRLAERLHARRHKLVIPEVVVWEWAEQLHQRVRGATLTLERLHADVAGSGLALCIPWPDIGDLEDDVDQADQIEDVVDRIEADLRTMAGVSIVTATLADGAEAIRNQVLQLGVGTRRNGVKTGAADGLVIAAVERCVQERVTNDPIVLCTGDAPLARHIAGLDGAPITVRTERELWASIATTAAVDPSVADAIHASVEFELAEWLARAPGSRDTEFPLLAAGVAVDDAVVGSAGRRVDVSYGFAVTVHDVELLDVDAVEVVDDDLVPHIAVADVTALVVADVVDQACDEHGQLPHLLDAATLRVDVAITAEFDRSWTYERFDCADAATVTTAA